MKAGAAILLAGTALGSVYGLGHFTLSRMLVGDAKATADLWSEAVLRTGAGNIHDALAEIEPGTLSRLLNAAQIDGVVVLRPGGSDAHAGGAETAADLIETVRHLAGAGAAAYAVPSGVYTRDRIGWFRQLPYRSWVIYPTERDASRLALRVDQTQMSTELASSFLREVLFSGGVAAITFASFMAGFSYRQRQLAAENAAIRHLALHDELTGLPNRKQFEDFTEEALTEAEAEELKVALFVLDLDGFKAVNDTLGHPVGDGLLQAAAKRLKASLRSGDLLARLSGDEFVIVVPKVADAAMLAPLAERLLTLLASPFSVDGHEIQVSGSIGLAVAPDNGIDIGSLMRNADFALYRAKSEGRRNWRFFDPKMAADLASRRTLEDGLRFALEKEHFQLLYQPQIELATGRVIGCEAMLRWRLAGRGLVPASVFMSVAEETGLVVPIGEWVIRQIARDCASIPADQRVALNLSAAQLKRDGMDAFLLETLKSHSIAPQRIEIEVNETILGRNESIAFTRLESIRDAGVRIVMDSFGVGTLSLGLLSRYSFDKVKVDRSFLMADEEKGTAVLAAICSLGRSLGFTVAGQGVETIEHAQLLRAAGCREAQGYYFGPPMPLENLLSHRATSEPMRLAAGA